MTSEQRGSLLLRDISTQMKDYIMNDYSIDWLEVCEHLGVDQRTIKLANPLNQLFHVLSRRGISVLDFYYALRRASPEAPTILYLRFMLNPSPMMYPTENIACDVGLQRILRDVNRRARKKLLQEPTIGDMVAALRQMNCPTIANDVIGYIAQLIETVEFNDTNYD